MKSFLLFLVLSAAQLSFAHEGPEWFDTNHPDVIEGFTYVIKAPAPQIMITEVPSDRCSFALVRSKSTSNYQWAYSSQPNWTSFADNHSTTALCGNSAECSEIVPRHATFYFAVRAHKNGQFGTWSNEYACRVSK